jgi:hypothetical protein
VREGGRGEESQREERLEVHSSERGEQPVRKSRGSAELAGCSLVECFEQKTSEW